MEALRLEPLPISRPFQAPTNLIQAQNGQLWITEQAGRIWVFNETQLDDDASEPSETLDITDRVSRRRPEEGLLGLALDPTNEEYLYVYYSVGKAPHCR